MLQGIQFVKRLRLLHDRNKQRAEVAVYFKRPAEAERLYVEMDRRDLAVDVRMRLGDWAHVLQLLQRSGGGDDATLALARTRMGDYFADRQQWGRAIPFYEAAGCQEALVECYYITEDYGALADTATALPEGSPLLSNIANKLQSVGLTDGAAQAFLRAGDIKGAVDCCVLLNQWDKAIELAEKHKLPQIESLLGKYAARLLESGKTISAVELYRRAHRDAESAKLLAKLAADVARSKLHPLRSKKLYVLAALEVEAHRKHTMNLAALTSGASGAKAAAATTVGVTARQAATMATQAAMTTLLKADADATVMMAGGGLTATGLNAASAGSSEAAAARTLDAAWHGAEAFHFLLLAQRQLYAGDSMGAMVTAQRLCLYEDMVDGRDIYSLIALTAYYNACYNTCSRAFIKLEGLEGIPPAEREAYSDLALAVFSQARPLDPPLEEEGTPCPSTGCKAVLRPWAINCMACGANFPGCVATGRPLVGPSEPTWRCGTCRHRALASAMAGRASCPLCHTAVTATAALASPTAEGESAAAPSSRGAVSSAAPSTANPKAVAAGVQPLQQEAGAARVASYRL